MIIWSRDRACQLETLLDSIKRHTFDIFDIDIVYSVSNKDYFDGYLKLKEIHPDIRLYKKIEGSGKEHLLYLIKQHESKQFCVSTDDTIFFSNITHDPAAYMKDCDIFSLRYGLNTVLQNHVTGEYGSDLINYEEHSTMIEWNFLDYHPHHNYGYPFGLDMHCYNKSMILPILEQINFDKPNELETGLFQFRDKINPKIKSFRQSCAVNVPITNMSTITSSAGVSLEELNKQFLEGKRLRYKISEIIGCHQLLEYELV